VHEFRHVRPASVREALRHVDVEGFAVIASHGDEVVPTFSEEDAKAIYAVRGALEALAARLFTETATPSQRAELRAAADELSRTTDPLESLATKDRFYGVLFEGAGSSVITQLIGPLHHRVAILRARSLSHEDRPRTAAIEINAIVSAIESGDAARAARAAADHVARAAALIFDGELVHAS
jgi:DNA-binding GntR family transcriptional regulator